jgi:hypothetical protein
MIKGWIEDSKEVSSHGNLPANWIPFVQEGKSHKDEPLKIPSENLTVKVLSNRLNKRKNR